MTGIALHAPRVACIHEARSAFSSRARKSQIEDTVVWPGICPRPRSKSLVRSMSDSTCTACDLPPNARTASVALYRYA